MTPKQLTAFRRDNLGFIFQTFNLFPTRRPRTTSPCRWRCGASRGVRRAAGPGTARPGRPVAPPQGAARADERRRVPARGRSARALASNPAVVFADEPTASLDAENGQAVMKLLTHLVRERVPGDSCGGDARQSDLLVRRPRPAAGGRLHGPRMGADGRRRAAGARAGLDPRSTALPEGGQGLKKVRYDRCHSRGGGRPGRRSSTPKG